MDKIIDASFDRVEKALTTLVNSIANYTANPQAAVELVKADSELIDGLKLLHTHQTNHARLLALRSLHTTLDTQIKDTLTTLSTTRAEILATPARKVVKIGEKEVEYHELLAYARRISAFTVPPGGFKSTGNFDSVGVGAVGGPGAIGGDASVGSTPGDTSGVAISVSTPTATAVVGAKPPNSSFALPEDWQRYMSPQEGMAEVWTPWPGEEAIRRGALASLQFGEEEVKEIEGGDGEKKEVEFGGVSQEEMELAAQQQAEEERLQEQMREQQELERQQREREMQLRREQAQVQAQAEAKVFEGLNALDDEDDD